MEIKCATLDKEKSELDQLLWNVLWEPLNLPRQFRQSIKLNSPQIELIAIDNNMVIGGLVANRLSKDKIEIRHIAVRSDYQRRSVGKFLVDGLIKLVQQNAPVLIQTYARNTSVSFFAKLGFTPGDHYLEHEEFVKHGIKFQQMCLEIPKDNSR